MGKSVDAWMEGTDRVSVSRHIACIIESQPWSIARDLLPDGGGCYDGHALAGVKLVGILNVEN